MISGCISNETFSRWIEGEATRNESEALDAHRAGCARCAARGEQWQNLARDVGAPVARSSADAFVAGVWSRIEARQDSPSAARRLWLAPATRAVLALAAVLAAVVVATGAYRALPLTPAGFQARGGRSPTPSLVRNLGVAVFWRRPGQSPVALEPGARVPAEAEYAFRYTNLEAGEPAYLMIYAIDAAREIHWFYPAWTDPATDPQSIRLDPGVRDRLLPDVVAPEGVARGPMKIVAWPTRRPESVRAVEARGGEPPPNDPSPQVIEVEVVP